MKRLKEALAAARQFEKKWDIHVDVKKEWKALEAATEELDDSDDVPEAPKKALVKELEKIKSQLDTMEADEFDRVLGNIEDAVTVEDFDSAWQDFYDWADEASVWVGIN